MNQHAIAVDWDGTCVQNKWPEMGDWMPGAVEALRELSEHAHIFIFTARISPVDPWGNQRQPEDVAMTVNAIRQKLDDAGLPMVGIHQGPGKPGALAYIDDRAVRYTGRPRSWAAVQEQVMALVEQERPMFPQQNQG